MNIYKELTKMIEECEKYSHVEELQLASYFIKDVRKRCGEREDFDELVRLQLSMSVGRVHADPRWFARTANHPHHIIRNRLLAWFIDNPRSEK